MTKDEIKAIFAKVQANQRLLDSCDLHSFSPTEEPVTIRKRYRCRRCGGEVDGAKVYWYELGLKHASREAGHG